MTEKYLMIIGNSNVGKSSITRLLLPHPRKFKGKSGKQPGSTLLIKPISQDGMSYKIIDLPGFGFMKRSSNRREEHVKNLIVSHIERNYENYFLSLIIINVLRIEDEMNKYYIKNKKTIPLSFEMIKFIQEFEIPSLIVFNKIDKLSIFEKKRKIDMFLKYGRDFGLAFVQLKHFKAPNRLKIPYLEFSALKKTNLDKLVKFISSRIN